MVSGIGETLRAARRRQGHSLADVADATRVRQTYLAAIEAEEFDALGGDVYARGFISSYARFLGLDPAPLLDAHRREQAGPEPEAPRRRPIRTDVTTGDVRVRSVRAAVVLVLTVVIVVALVAAGLWSDAGAAWPP